MSLTPGARLGVYEVTGLIGTGGMGEVYRARDTALGRDVAIKVLPDVPDADVGPSPGSGPPRAGARDDRVARLDREARALATLNHPNIAAIHGLQEIPSPRPGQRPGKGLVLELVEGETLAERLRKGPLPLAEALEIAGQIADALEAAHEKGIVHRDLKPANVKVTPGGTVKVLDFGVARIVVADPDEASTVTTAGTSPGVVLGTPAYMAPEQAKGQPADRRADVWAFGVLLYEMLAGRRPFGGSSAQEILVAVLTAEPDWEPIPRTIRQLLRRCLARDPRQRLRDIGDFRFLIDGDSDTSAAPARRHSVPAGVALASLVVGALAVAAAAWGLVGRRAELLEGAVWMTATLPPGVSVSRGPGLAASVALSPDGRTLVVAGMGTDGQRLYRRPIDRLEAGPMIGTEGGSSPFFSWDGAWVGFFADGRLKRVPADGGATADVATVTAFPAGASWGPDDRIVFVSGARSMVYAVPARGGEPRPLTRMQAGEFAHFRPDVLPGGRAVLFESGDRVHALDLGNGQQTALIEGAAPRFASSGHLILSRGATLFATAFDPSRLAVSGPVVPIVEDVAGEPGDTGGVRHYAISRTGTLAYVPSTVAHELVVLDADGTEHLVAEPQPVFENPQISPDGRRIAVATTRRVGDASDIWIHDVESRTAWRLTHDGGRAPVWTPDGSEVTFSDLRREGRGIYSKSADGRGDARPVVRLGEFHWLVGWTPDARTLAYGIMEGPAEDGVSRSSIVALTGDESRRVVGPGNTWGGRLSPDGRLLAYYSLDSGSFEIYVTPFPDGGTRWLIADGTDPSWAPDGTEIYYRSLGRLMAARVDTSAGVRVLTRRVVVEPFLPPLYDDYAVHPDGRRLVMVRPAGDAQTRQVTVVINWPAELRRLVHSSPPD